MAHRAVDIKTSYFKSLFVSSAPALFRIGSASLHRPLDARPIPRSAALEVPSAGVFAFTCALAVTHKNVTATAIMPLRNRSEIANAGSIAFARSISSRLIDRQLRH